MLREARSIYFNYLKVLGLLSFKRKSNNGFSNNYVVSVNYGFLGYVRIVRVISR